MIFEINELEIKKLSSSGDFFIYDNTSLKTASELQNYFDKDKKEPKSLSIELNVNINNTSDDNKVGLKIIEVLSDKFDAKVAIASNKIQK